MTVSNISHIPFGTVTFNAPSKREIQAGLYALNKMSGDFVKIPRNMLFINPTIYSLYAPASAFPIVTSKYNEKYNDLVRARDILKEDRYGENCDTIGKAIGLIKRFLDSTNKV